MPRTNPGPIFKEVLPSNDRSPKRPSVLHNHRQAGDHAAGWLTRTVFLKLKGIHLMAARGDGHLRFTRISARASAVKCSTVAYVIGSLLERSGRDPLSDAAHSRGYPTVHLSKRLAAARISLALACFSTRRFQRGRGSIPTPFQPSSRRHYSAPKST